MIRNLWNWFFRKPNPQKTIYKVIGYTTDNNKNYHFIKEIDKVLDSEEAAIEYAEKKWNQYNKELNMPISICVSKIHLGHTVEIWKIEADATFFHKNLQFSKIN